MRIVIFVRKIDPDDSRMGFFSAWVSEFAKKCDHIDVIAWQESIREGLPENVILSELTGKTIKKIFLLQNKLLQLLPRADALYVHMNPEYSLAAFPLCALFRVPITQWYAHGAVSTRRKLMERVVKNIATSSEKGFRNPLYKRKVHVVGQGIDTNFFSYSPKHKDGLFSIIQVSRISPVKDVESVIRAVHMLKVQKKIRLQYEIYGEPALEHDRVYLASLKNMVSSYHLTDIVRFRGGISYKNLPNIYQTADVLVNMSKTGSMDKVVLEALATGLTVITANDAYTDILPQSALVKENDHLQLYNALLSYIAMDSTQKSREALRLREFVEREHNLSMLIDKLVEVMAQK